MDDLLAFWRDRLDETAEIVETIRSGGFAASTWTTEPSKSGAWVILREAGDPTPLGYVTNGRGEHRHIARHDPARTLRDVAADRAILEHHRAVGYYPATDLGRSHYWCSCGEPQPCLTVRARVSVYSDHPGYKEDWKP